MQQPVPLPQHLWLQKLVGEWTFEGEGFMGPDQPPAKSSGKESVKSFGPFWVICSGTGTGDHGAWDYQITLGYDPSKQIFPGTFIGTTMSYLWTYTGTLDTEEKRLILATEGINMRDGKMTQYRDTIELIDENTRLLYSEMIQPDGSWLRFMTHRYTRQS
jgi:hypothetical protein